MLRRISRRADALMRIVPRETTIVPAAGGYMVPEEFTQIFLGEIGHYEGTVIHGTGLTHANVQAIIAVMKEREIKPNADGNYLLLLPGNTWARILSDA